MHTKADIAQDLMMHLALLNEYKVSQPGRESLACVEFPDFLDNFTLEEFVQLGRREFANLAMLREHPKFYASAHLGFQSCVLRYQARDAIDLSTE